MKIKNPKSGKVLDIGSAIVKFTKKNGQVSDKVRVVIYYDKKGSKRGSKRKRDLPIPKEIDTDDLAWKKYGGKVLLLHITEMEIVKIMIILLLIKVE